MQWLSIKEHSPKEGNLYLTWSEEGFIELMKYNNGLWRTKRTINAFGPNGTSVSIQITTQDTTNVEYFAELNKPYELP